MTQQQQPEYYTLDQIADKLQVSRDTVQRWIADKELTAYRLGKQYRVYYEDLDTFLEERKNKQ